MAKADKSPLWLALDHAMIAATGTANFAPYCHFQPGWLVGYDGLIAAGSRVGEHLHVAPHTETFRHAIMRAGTPYSLTVKQDGGLVCKGDKMRADIPTFPATAIPNVLPDAPLGTIGEPLRRALIEVGKIASVKADAVIASSVLLRSNTAVATDGSTVLEAWHGGELPAAVLLPVEYATALGKVKALPTHAGWNKETFTIWFGDAQWLRANVYSSEYPDTDLYFAKLMAQCREYRPIPDTMLQAIETLKPFRESEFLTLTDYGINTRKDGTGAAMQFEHYFPYRGEFPTDGLRMAATHGKEMAFCSQGAYWYGDVIRGITALDWLNNA